MATTSMPVSLVDATERVRLLIVNEVTFRVYDWKPTVDVIVDWFTIVSTGHPPGNILHQLVFLVAVLS